MSDLITVNCEEPLYLRHNRVDLQCTFSFTVAAEKLIFTPYASKWCLRVHLLENGTPMKSQLCLQFIQCLRLSTTQTTLGQETTDSIFLTPLSPCSPLKPSPKSARVRSVYPQLGHAHIQNGCISFDMFSYRIDPSARRRRPYLKAVDITLNFKRNDGQSHINLDMILPLADYSLASVWNSLLIPLPIISSSSAEIIDEMAIQAEAVRRCLQLESDTGPLLAIEAQIKLQCKDLAEHRQEVGWHYHLHEYCSPIPKDDADELIDPALLSSDDITNDYPYAYQPTRSATRPIDGLPRGAEPEKENMPMLMTDSSTLDKFKLES